MNHDVGLFFQSRYQNLITSPRWTVAYDSQQGINTSRNECSIFLTSINLVFALVFAKNLLCFHYVSQNLHDVNHVNVKVFFYRFSWCRAHWSKFLIPNRSNCNHSRHDESPLFQALENSLQGWFLTRVTWDAMTNNYHCTQKQHEAAITYLHSTTKRDEQFSPTFPRKVARIL